VIKLLILVHIVAGAAALAALVGAVVTKKGGLNHRKMGKIYTIAMAVALTLAVVVSVLTANIFLLLIGVFSGYFVYTGWRLAKAKDGIRSLPDRMASILMLIGAVLMLVYGIYIFANGESLGVALGVFGVFAFMPAWQDYSSAKWPVGKERIVLHLSRMGGASIATVTAVFVVNVQTSPAFIAWLLPSLIGTPAIIYFARSASEPSHR